MITISQFTDCVPALLTIEEDCEKITTIEKTQAIQVCQRIQQTFASIIRVADQEIEKHDSSQKQLHNQMVQSEEQSSKLREALTKSQQETSNLEGQLAGLQQSIATLDGRISTLNSEIAQLNKKIKREEQERIDAATDLIPGVGIVGAIVTGRWQRAIPFYSQVNGIISLAKQNVENANREKKKNERIRSDTANQRKEVEEKLRKQKEETTALKQRISKMEKERDEADKMVKLFGQKVTRIRNVKLEIENLNTRFTFLSQDVSTFEELVVDDLLEAFQVEDFRSEVGKIRTNMKQLTQ